MTRKIPGKETDRYYCQYCGFPCKEGRDVEGSFGESGWDFTDGDESGSDLITNGAFTANANNWTASGCVLTSAAGGQSGNCLTVTRSSGDEQYAYQALSDLDIGLMYRLTAYVKSGTSGDEAFALRLLNPDRTVTKYSETGTTSTTWTQYTLYWRAFYGDNVVALVKNSVTAGTMLFDTVSAYAYDFKGKEAMTACPLCGSRNWKGSSW